jgi:hypothetical protein
MNRVDETSQANDGRAMLVIMEHGNVHETLKFLLDVEAVGSLDILEVYATEGGGKIADTVNECIRILGIHANIY